MLKVYIQWLKVWPLPHDTQKVFAHRNKLAGCTWNLIQTPRKFLPSWFTSRCKRAIRALSGLVAIGLQG